MSVYQTRDHSMRAAVAVAKDGTLLATRDGGRTVVRVSPLRPDIAHAIAAGFVVDRRPQPCLTMAHVDVIARDVVAPLLAHLRAQGVRLPALPGNTAGVAPAPMRRSAPSAAQKAVLARAQRALARADAVLRA